MAIVRSVGQLNPGALLNGSPIQETGQAGLQTAANALNSVYGASATRLLHWPARNAPSPYYITLPADTDDALLSAYVDIPAKRTLQTLVVDASVTSGTMQVLVKVPGPTTLATITVTTGGTLVRQTANFSRSTPAVYTINVITVSATAPRLYGVHIYLRDEA